MAVKQVFETYVYDPGLSSVGQMPFVLMEINGAHGKACGGGHAQMRGEIDQGWAEGKNGRDLPPRAECQSVDF